MADTNEAVMEEKKVVTQEPEVKEPETKPDEGFKAGWARDTEEKKEEPESKEEDKQEEKPEIKAPVKNDGKDAQRQKTLDGIVKAKNAEIAETKRDRDRLAKEIEELRATKQPEKIKEVIEDSIVNRLRASPSIKNLESEYGKEFVSAIEEAVSMVSDTYDKKYGELNQSWETKFKAIEEESKKRLERFEPVVESHQHSLDEAHRNAIESAHPDLHEYLDSVDDEGNRTPGMLTEWIMSHPLSEQWATIAKKGPTGGTAEQVNYMLNVFKQEKGIGVKAKADTSKKQAALADMATVKTKKAPITPSSGGETNSFSSGWKKA